MGSSAAVAGDDPLVELSWGANPIDLGDFQQTSMNRENTQKNLGNGGHTHDGGLEYG